MKAAMRVAVKLARRHFVAGDVAQGAKVATDALSLKLPPYMPTDRVFPDEASKRELQAMASRASK